MTIIDSIPLNPKKILILGDLLIDETWYVETTKISPEAPVPVASLVSKKPISTPGGAGLAAGYAAKENIPSLFLSLFSQEAKEILDNTSINYICIETIENNIKKIRYIDKASRYHLIRIDTDNLVIQKAYPYSIIETILNLIKNNNIGCIAMLNYRKGVFNNREMIQNIISLAKNNNIYTFADTRGDITKFINCNAIKLNHIELSNALDTTGCLSSYELREKMNIDILITTKAAKGAEACSKIETISIEPRKMIGNPDVTGAGDIFDINFCYDYYCRTNKSNLSESLAYAVNRATEFVRQPIETRLC